MTFNKCIITTYNVMYVSPFIGVGVCHVYDIVAALGYISAAKWELAIGGQGWQLQRTSTPLGASNGMRCYYLI